MNTETPVDLKLLSTLRTVNDSAAFNRWAGLDVLNAAPGSVELQMPWRDELGQYSGFLHASLIGGLIDTACGFAASTVSGPVLASQFSVRCLAPAQGQHFLVKGRVVKAGRRQVFASAELYAIAHPAAEPRLCATGDAILVPIQPA